MASPCAYDDGLDHCPFLAVAGTDHCVEHTQRLASGPKISPPKQGDYVHIDWQRIPGPGCITINGEPFSASRAKIEWPGNGGLPSPILTIEQAVWPGSLRGGDLAENTVPATLVSEGYLVSRADWEAFQKWLRKQPRPSIDDLTRVPS